MTKMADRFTRWLAPFAILVASLVGGWFLGATASTTVAAHSAHAGAQHLASNVSSEAGSITTSRRQRQLGAVQGTSRLPTPSVLAARTAAGDSPQLSGVLRDAAKGKGNFGLGSATQEQADAAGQAWVGNGASLASDGKTWVSQDGLRQFRAPSFKPNLNQWQSNFEWRVVPRGPWQGNGHLDITDPP